jgi:hypothetical protein
METQRLSAILLIAGFGVMLVGFLFNVGGIYQTTDLAERVRIIEENKTRWNINQTMTGFGILLLTIGFVVLATRLRSEANALIPTLGAASLIIGAISGFYFLYRYTTDPLGAFSGKYPGFEPLYNGLSLLGLLLFGIAILQAGLPAWLGYLTGGAAAIYGLVFLVTGSGFLTPGFVTLLGLVIAIVLLWQKPLP